MPVGYSLILAVSSFEQGIFTKANPFGRWTATFRINLCDYEKESVETLGFNALFWCRWWDSNPHGGLAQRILSPSRLPIPSRRHVLGIIPYFRGGGNTPAGVFAGRFSPAAPLIRPAAAFPSRSSSSARRGAPPAAPGSRGTPWPQKTAGP